LRKNVQTSDKLQPLLEFNYNGNSSYYDNRRSAVNVTTLLIAMQLGTRARRFMNEQRRRLRRPLALNCYGKN